MISVNLSDGVRRLLWVGFMAYIMVVPVLVSYRAHADSLAILLHAMVLFLAAGALGYVLGRSEFRADLDHATAARAFWTFLALGGLLRVAFALQFPPVQYSDFLYYLEAAERLVAEGRYGYTFPEGELRASRPPGYPFMLSALMMVFGRPWWLPLALNVTCCAVTCGAVYALGMLLIRNRLASVFAVAMIALWPDAIAGSGYAANEWPSLELLTGALWAMVRGQNGSTRHVALAGLASGVGALVRPAFVLMPLAWSAYAVLSVSYRDRSRWVAGVVTLLLAAAVVVPWSVRNYRVLHAYVPISTNGGSVFYRANNPLADGSFSDRGERDLDALRGDEVNWNRTGFAWGMEWIRRDPLGFLALIPKKMALLVASDSSSTSWAVERAHNERGLRYALLRFLAESWWNVVLLLLLVGAVRCRDFFWADPLAGLLLGTVLYVVAVHAVFESQARHHQPLYGVMALLVAMAIWPPRAAKIAGHA